MSAVFDNSTNLPVTRPRMSVRAMAIFLQLPALQQMQILHDQKYPKGVPQVYKKPYYQPAATGIRALMESHKAGGATARAQIQAVSQPSRRMHNLRVLELFLASEHANRRLSVASLRKYYAQIGELELRLSPDVYAKEDDEDRYIYFNFKAEEFNPEAARRTVEIAHWALEVNGVDVKPEQIEFVDLFTGVLHKVKKRRKKTITLLEENAKLIGRLWPGIDP